MRSRRVDVALLAALCMAGSLRSPSPKAAVAVAAAGVGWWQRRRRIGWRRERRRGRRRRWNTARCDGGRARRGRRNRKFGRQFRRCARQFEHARDVRLGRQFPASSAAPARSTMAAFRWPGPARPGAGLNSPGTNVNPSTSSGGPSARLAFGPALRGQQHQRGDDQRCPRSTASARRTSPPPSRAGRRATRRPRRARRRWGRERERAPAAAALQPRALRRAAPAQQAAPGARAAPVADQAVASLKCMKGRSDAALVPWCASAGVDGLLAEVEPRHFTADEVAVDAVAAHQSARRAILDDAARLQHHDAIEAAQGRETVCDRDHGAARHQAVQRLAHRFLRFRSSAEVASSSRRIGASLRNARAMAMRCRCPGDSFTPRSPMIVCTPSGKVSTKLAQRGERKLPSPLRCSLPADSTARFPIPIGGTWTRPAARRPSPNAGFPG